MKTIIKPLITEKSMELSKKNWYVFTAPIDKNKNELKRLIEETFGVKVLEIKTLVMKGKTKRQLRSRREQKLSDWKKVLVRLKEGQKIDLLE